VDGLSNFTNINWVIVPLAVGGWVGVVGILPGLRNCPVVPDVPVVGKAVGYIPRIIRIDNFCIQLI